jgi:prolyl-tRNA synthetase
VEVLFDDRDESPGVKFNDADLIGLPVRLTVSERALGQGGIELKLRPLPDKTIVPIDESVSRTRSELEALQSSLRAALAPVEYNG